MRKLWGIFFLLFITALSGYSQFISHCTFYTEDNVKFTVYLDGEKKNDEPQTRVRVLNLTEPHFKLKIVFADSTVEPIIRKAFPLQDNNGYPVDVIYTVSKSKKGDYKIHFMEQKIYPGYIKPIKTVKPIISAADSLKIRQSQKPQTPCTGKSLAPEDFSAALKSITERNSDESKLLISKQIISSNCVMVDQIKSVLQQISMEENKLILAKFSYEFTIDKGNYFKLNELFKNEQNIDDLYQAIAK